MKRTAHTLHREDDAGNWNTVYFRTQKLSFKDVNNFQSRMRGKEI